MKLGSPIEDAPEGYTWKCPDCGLQATLGDNARYHTAKTRHGKPILVKFVPHDPAKGKDSFIWEKREWSHPTLGHCSWHVEVKHLGALVPVYTITQVPGSSKYMLTNNLASNIHLGFFNSEKEAMDAAFKDWKEFTSKIT